MFLAAKRLLGLPQSMVQIPSNHVLIFHFLASESVLSTIFRTLTTQLKNFKDMNIIENDSVVYLDLIDCRVVALNCFGFIIITIFIYAIEI